MDGKMTCSGIPVFLTIRLTVVFILLCFTSIRPPSLVFAAGSAQSQPTSFRPISIPLHRHDHGQYFYGSDSTMRATNPTHSTERSVTPAPWARSNVALHRVPALVFATIRVGTPPVSVAVQIDTGSADLIVPSTQCKKCRDKTRYNVSMSSTGRRLFGCDGASKEPCAVDITYGDGTRIMAHVVEDLVEVPLTEFETFSVLANVDVMYACFPKAVFTKMEIDGIWGLAYDGLAVNRMPTVFSLIIKKYNLPDMFSLYVGSGIGKNDGFLTIGGFDHNLYEGEIHYTPVLKPHYYSVQLVGMRIANTTVPLRPSDFGATFIDSGTTLTLVPFPVLAVIRRVFQTSFCHLPLVCATSETPYTIFDGQCFYAFHLPNGYPNIQLVFAGGVVVSVPPSVYFTKMRQFDRFVFCFGILAMPIAHINFPLTVLGDTFLGAAYVVFDRQHGRIGFATPRNGAVPGQSGGLVTNETDTSGWNIYPPTFWERIWSWMSAHWQRLILNELILLALLGLCILAIGKWMGWWWGRGDSSPRDGARRPLLRTGVGDANENYGTLHF